MSTSPEPRSVPMPSHHKNQPRSLSPFNCNCSFILSAESNLKDHEDNGIVVKNNTVSHLSVLSHSNRNEVSGKIGMYWDVEQNLYIYSVRLFLLTLHTSVSAHPSRRFAVPHFKPSITCINSSAVKLQSSATVMISCSSNFATKLAYLRLLCQRLGIESAT